MSSLRTQLEAQGLNPDTVASLIAAHEAEVEAAASKPGVRKPVSLKVSEKGCVFIGGGQIRRFGVSLYPEEWMEVLAQRDTIYEFIVDHAGEVKFQGATETTVAASRDKILNSIAEMAGI